MRDGESSEVTGAAENARRTTALRVVVEHVLFVSRQFLDLWKAALSPRACLPQGCSAQALEDKFLHFLLKGRKSKHVLCHGPRGGLHLAQSLRRWDGGAPCSFSIRVHLPCLLDMNVELHLVVPEPFCSTPHHPGFARLDLQQEEPV
ncbi:unnamed protein product [Ixodes hexagonus]